MVNDTQGFSCHLLNLSILGPRTGNFVYGAKPRQERRRAAGEIAEVVSEVGVEPAHERLLAEAGVEPEVHLAKEEVAEGVVAVLVRQLERLHDVADRLRHLAPADRPVAVDVEAAVERDAGG